MTDRQIGRTKVDGQTVRQKKRQTKGTDEVTDRRMDKKKQTKQDGQTIRQKIGRQKRDRRSDRQTNGQKERNRQKKTDRQ